MKKIVIYLLFLAMPLGLLARGSCRVEEELPLQLMGKELMRNFKILKKEKPPIYYLSYTYWDFEEKNISVNLGGVEQQQDQHYAFAEVQARAGSPTLDNTHLIRGEQRKYGTEWNRIYGVFANNKHFQMMWWDVTRRAAEAAQADYDRAAASEKAASQARDQSADFAFPPLENFCLTQELSAVDMEKVKELLLQASKLVLGEEVALSSNFNFTLTRGHWYFADSQGSRLKVPYSYININYTLENKLEDGTILNRRKFYHISDETQLPSQEQLNQDVLNSLEELKDLSQAPQADPITVPAILKARAAAVLMHEALGHRLESQRQKDEDSGQTLADKVGQQILPSFLSVVDDPTQVEFKGEPLRGHYLYDDEGVRARPVTLVENGVLKNFLTYSSPIKGFPSSNGHGRRQLGKRAVARMGVMLTTASETIPYEKMEQMLVDEIKRQNKPYGFIVDDLDGGYTVTGGLDAIQSLKLEVKRMWRIYPDGHKELVRGLELIGTPLNVLNKIVAAADDYDLFNGSCGSNSGLVPQTNGAPSFLFSELEMQKVDKSDTKPPLLSSPFVKHAQKGGQK